MILEWETGSVVSVELTRGLSQAPESQSTAFSSNQDICVTVTEAWWDQTAEEKLGKDFCVLPSANVRGEVVMDLLRGGFSSDLQLWAALLWEDNQHAGLKRA